MDQFGKCRQSGCWSNLPRRFVVSLVYEGALLVQAGHVMALLETPVYARRAVVAGDSFAAAMTYWLAVRRPIEEAFCLEITAGIVVLTPGTDLCHRCEVDRLAATVGISGPTNGASDQ